MYFEYPLLGCFHPGSSQLSAMQPFLFKSLFLIITEINKTLPVLKNLPQYGNTDNLLTDNGDFLSFVCLNKFFAVI